MTPMPGGGHRTLARDKLTPSLAADAHAPVSVGGAAPWPPSRLGRKPAGMLLATVLMLLGVSEPARAGEDKVDLNVNIAGIDVRLLPYALDQFDVGGAFDGRPDAPAAGVNTRRARNGVRAKLPDDVTLSLVWDFGGSGYSGPRYGHSRLHEAEVKYSGLDHFVLEFLGLVSS